MTLKDADTMIREARLLRWTWLVNNAEHYGMTRAQMLVFWQHNQHMTPRQPFPRRVHPSYFEDVA